MKTRKLFVAALALVLTLSMTATAFAAAVRLHTAATGRNQAALHSEVAIYADAGRIDPSVTVVFESTSLNAQGACAFRPALNGEAARSVQSVDVGLIRVVAAYIQSNTATLDGVGCSVIEDDGGPGRQLHSRFGSGGEVNAVQGESLAAVIPGRVRLTCFIIIE